MGFLAVWRLALLGGFSNRILRRFCHALLLLVLVGVGSCDEFVEDWDGDQGVWG